MPPQRSTQARLREARVSLLMPGIACVIAAVVGGGLEAAGMTLPVLDSLVRQVILGLFGLGLVLLSLVDLDRKVVTAERSTKQDETDAESVMPQQIDDGPVFRWKVTTKPDGTREVEMEFFDEALAKEHLIRRDSIFADDKREGDLNE